MMADTNSSSSTSGGGGPEPIPQWKKELIQRRKNLAKTIGAAATQVHDSASTVAAALTTPTTPRAGPGGGPFGCGQKDPSIVAPPVVDSPTPPASTTESSASPAPLVVVEHKGNNSDSPASPTAATPSSTSLFGAPVFVGHSHSSPVNEQPPVLVKPLSAATTTITNTTTRGAESPLLVGGTSAEKQPLQHTQSHSNDGTESTSGSANSRSYNIHNSALSGSPKGGGSGGDFPANSGPAGKYAATVSTSVSGVSVDCELTRPAPGETSNFNSEIGWKIKKNTSSASSSVSLNSGTKMVAASAEDIIYDNSRFVGEANRERVGGGAPNDVDSSEELKYGPGIVSKLRCRYLSLALRQSANKQRPSLNNMRRATSLNNLLDEECEDLSEREHSIDGKDNPHEKSIYQQGKMGREQHNNQLNLQQPKARTPDEYISTFQKSVQNCYTRSSRQTSKKNEYNRYNKQRGAESLKRALSVEALVRYDHKSWERDVQKENLYSSNDSNVIILDEICTNGTATTNNNCQSLAMNNKADLIVDCVTIEEKIINGREKGDPKPKRLTSFIDADERPPPDLVRQTLKIFEANANRKPIARTNGAAGDVAAKVASYKSIISQDKPPITHPKPPLSPKKPNIIPRTASPKSNGTTIINTANGLKDKQNLPKLDITAIRNNLDTTNNLKNTQVATPLSHNQNNTSTPLSVRVELQTSYRLKYDSPALSPNTMPHKAVSTTTTNAANRPESPRVSAAANMQNNTNSTALTFVDSPSIQALASKLSNLNIVTSTPAGTRSPTPSDSSAAAPPPVPPRNILQYATSDEEDPDDPEDQQREYSINSDHGSDSQTDDLELDDEPDAVRKVSPIAMENISKAGVTTQFRFNSQSQNKSHLPSLNNNSNSSTTTASAPSTGGIGGGAKLLASKKLNVDDHLSSNSSSTSSSPITVPAAAAVVVTQKPPIPQSRESLGTNGHKATVPNSGSVAANNNRNIHNSSNANTSVNSHGSKLVITASDGNNANGVSESAASAALSASNVSSDVKSVNLTAREIEKNQINLEKNEESISSASAVAGSGGGINMLMAKSNNNINNNNSGGDVSASVGSTSGGTGGGDFFMAKWGSPAPAAAATGGSAIASNPLAGLIQTKKKVKAPPPPIETNTMVFNFSDRKEPVPDYIENDGIILRPRPRELPKPGESGFVVLGDLTLETSTDPDDSWAMGPPSPCDVEFENANVLINGKSSMRTKTSRDNRFKIQFDDSLTSTFEYPSETSLLETTNGIDGDPAGAANGQMGPTNEQTTAAGGTGGSLSFGENGLLSHKNTLLSSMPLGSAPFASYTPVKAAIDTNFELGVTRTPSPSSTASSSTASSTSSSSSSSVSSSSSISNNDQHHQQQQHQHHHLNHNHHHHLSHQHHLHSNSSSSSQLGTNGYQQSQQPHLDRINGGGSTEANDLLLLNGETSEPESIQYLKPASDEQTVNWSQGTRVTDLLF